MLELNLQSGIFLVCVAAFTIAAAVWDFRFRRIPNKLTVPMFVLGLIYHAWFGGWAGTENGLLSGGLKSAFIGFFIGFGTLFALWLIGGGGGGDVKLMGALSVWLGYPLILLVLICSTAFVLIGTLSQMVWSVATRGRKALPGQVDEEPSPKKRISSANVEERTKRRVMAFAVPVAFATWTVLMWKIRQL